MSTPKFSKSEAISFGFAKARKNWKFFIPVVLISILINLGPRFDYSFSSGKALDQNLIGYLIVTTIFWLLAMIIQIGLIVIALKFVDNKKALLGDIITYKPLVSYTVGSILYGLIVAVGLILLIIPGIIWSIKLQYYSYLIVDQGLKPVAALKKSWQMTKGVKWQLFLLGILLMLVNLAGVLTLGVGLFLSIPTTMLASAYVYRKLSS